MIENLVSKLGQPPSLTTSRVLAGLVTASWIFVRLVVFRDTLFPLTYVLPLLLCIWSLDLGALWAMAAVFAAAHTVKQAWLASSGAMVGVEAWASYAATLVNITVGALAVHLVVVLRRRIDVANQQLQEQVEQLRAQDEEIRAQSEELAQQNEELTQQAEELSRQSEELGQQAEELAQFNEQLSSQNVDLQHESEEVRSLNAALARREGLLQVLLERAREARPEAEAIDDVCRAAVGLFGETAHAVVAYESIDDLLHVRGAAGAAATIPREAVPLEGRFAQVVMQERRIACLNDTHLRPDLATLQVPGQPAFRSVLSAPLTVRQRSHGVLSVYSFVPHDWTDEQFRLIEWLAAQCSQILETLRLQQELQRQAALIDLTPDAILVRTTDGEIRSWSRGAEVLYGWTASEAVGRLVNDLLQTQFPEPLPVVEAALERNGEWTGDVRHRTRHGRELIVQSRWLLHRAADGVHVEVLESNVDVTERVESKEALRHANRVKDEFLATLSHELRTPLNAIVGWSQMLRSGTLDPAMTRKAVEVIARNAQAQNRLIEDVLDVSRIVTGKLRLDAEPTCVPVLLEAALESLALAAESKGVEVVRRFDPGLPVVIGDAARLQQVFWNLISNAVKFTPSGGRVEVSAQQAGSHLEVRVRDSGIGIRPDFLAQVFERFSQVDGSSSRSHAGLGLGLAIVRHLVELHGGLVWAESEGEGKGAVFTVALPIRAVFRSDSPAQPSAGVSAALSPPDRMEGTLAGTRVIVVDDEQDARELVRAVLSSAGASVTVADSAAVALRLLQGDGRVDAMVTDISMPDVDGFALLADLRRQGIQVPAIALTAYGREDDAARALAAGFNLHISKPVLPDVLVSKVAALARSRVENGSSTVME